MKTTDNKIIGLGSIHGSVLIYDVDWQYPAITEQHAFHQSLNFLPNLDNVIYLAFPWATLIDLLMRKQPANYLLDLLIDAQAKTRRHKYVITVCQHIHMLKFQHIFSRANVTHVFWSHAVKGQDFFPEYYNIKIFPFPLYPVQATQAKQKLQGQRKYLYSFIGAKANKWYLTKSRNNIIDYLSQDSRGLVVGREQWHFNKIVYDYQVNKNSDSDIKNNLIDQEASLEYSKTLSESTFSLCPSGTGPNSIRLWESVCHGSIPVVLSDTYRPPGNEALWKEATVSCAERLEDILALPDSLEALALDEALLQRKRHALYQIFFQYGPDFFIYDILKLFLSLYSETATANLPRQFLSYRTLLRMVSEINQSEVTNERVIDIFIIGCSSRILENSSLFHDHYIQNEELRNAYHNAIVTCSRKSFEAMSRVLDHKRLNLI